jgi:hypothetical protein
VDGFLKRRRDRYLPRSFLPGDLPGR